MGNQYSNLLKKDSIKYKHPKVAKEWDYKKNKLDPDQVRPGTKAKYWWICKEGHSFEASPYLRTRNVYDKTRNRHINPTGCPYCSGQKVGYGNDFKSKHPKIAKEWDLKKNELQPNEVMSGSTKKYWWICKEGHSYFSRLDHRVYMNAGCPYCYGKLVGYGNDLKNSYPKIAKEWHPKNKESPDKIYKYSSKKYWWICDNNHEYESRLSHRAKSNVGCPYCVNQKVSIENSLFNLDKKLIKEWDYEKNKISPKEVSLKSNRIVWWLCKDNHSFRQNINRRTVKKSSCPYCLNQKVGYGNDLESKYPKIAKEWDFKKNKDRPSDLVPGSHHHRWWICQEGHSWKASVAHRTQNRYDKTRKNIRKPTGCPYCSGSIPHEKNNLKYHFPEVAKEWDYEKNKNKPEDYLSQSGFKAWWVCPVGHSYKTTISHRTPHLKGSSRLPTGCPYCTISPRSKEEVYLSFELMQFFDLDIDDHKIKLDKLWDVDIKIKNIKTVVEYDGSYWHKDKVEMDKRKTNLLRKNGWTVIRVREKPLKIISRKYNVSSISGRYKETSNKVLKKLNSLGYEVKDLNKYLDRKTLINKKNADKYMIKLLKQKN